MRDDEVVVADGGGGSGCGASLGVITHGADAKQSGPLFSIIVPVFNIGKYLQDCVGSILAQDFEDYEILLVDDGSTDSSGCICDDLENGNEKIKALHKGNGGLSSARNYGIRKAQGRYIVFLDGDDMLAEGALSLLANIARNGKYPDAIIVPYIKYDEEEKRHDWTLAGDYFVDSTYPPDVFRKLMIEQNIPAIAVSIILDRKHILKRGLFFEEGLLHEDELWTPMAILGASSVIVAQRPTYIYRVNRPGSIMQNLSEKNERSLVIIIHRLFVLARRGGVSKDVARCYLDHCAKLAWLIIDREYRLCVMPQPRPAWLEKKAGVLLSFLRDSRVAKYRLIYLWVRVFGLDSLRYLKNLAWPMLRKKNDAK